jgi:ABC-2 type transport system ATP-binding protein
MGIAPQELGIYLQLSVRKNLTFFGRLRGLRGRQLDERIEQVACALALDELLEKPAQELSGGEKRRLHAAMAMICPVSLLLLDEPTAGVDVRTRNQLLDYLKQLAQEGVAICYTTHYFGEVERLAASIAILEQGSLIAQGGVDELIATKGSTVVEVSFDGPVPPDLVTRGLMVGDSVLRITETGTGAALTRTLTSLSIYAEHVRSVELVQPSLESVYLAITGRRFAQEELKVAA